MTAPKKGDRVRVVLEGVVAQAGNFPERLWLRESPGSPLTALHSDHVVSVEVIAPPEPEWQPGDVIVCEHGDTYIRDYDDNWRDAGGIRATGPCLPRTGVLPVRDGKPVTP